MDKEELIGITIVLIIIVAIGITASYNPQLLFDTTNQKSSVPTPTSLSEQLNVQVNGTSFKSGDTAMFTIVTTDIPKNTNLTIYQLTSNPGTNMTEPMTWTTAITSGKVESSVTILYYTFTEPVTNASYYADV
jgi:hypothetical protein